ncbi:MAG: hypothetical protein OIF58_16580, partial [Cohaesibacter sp.]|nr:hypothetical protein [Cohaesibacter sp.]
RANPGDAGDITMLAVSALRKNAGNAYPNLRLVQKLGAGTRHWRTASIHQFSLPNACLLPLTQGFDGVLLAAQG